MELWDAYDENGAKLDETLIRGEKVPEGMFHLVSEILVLHDDGTYLLMQRDYNKPIAPGKYEISAGGSVLKGETEIIGARRELFEETGIKETKLIPVFTEISKERGSIFNMFYCKTNCNKDCVTLQKGETISFKWISQNELKEMLFDENCKIVRPDRVKRTLEFLQKGRI